MCMCVSKTLFPAAAAINFISIKFVKRFSKIFGRRPVSCVFIAYFCAQLLQKKPSIKTQIEAAVQPAVRPNCCAKLEGAATATCVKMCSKTMS